MPDVPLQTVRQHGHGNASPPDVTGRYLEDQASFASPASHSLRAESPIYDTTLFSPKKPWYTHRICCGRVWVWIVLFFIAAIAIIGGVLGHYASNFREKSYSVPEQNHNDGLNSHVWYTIQESSAAAGPKGYLGNLTRNEQGKKVLLYPDDVRGANDTHWQFLRVDPEDIKAEPLTRPCDDAWKDGRAFYWLKNKAQGPKERLAFNATGFGSTVSTKLEEKYENQPMGLVFVEFVGTAQLWYADIKREGDQFVLFNCGTGLKHARSLGRRSDGSENGAEAVLMKNVKGAESNITWTISSNIGGETLKITEPLWETFE